MAKNTSLITEIENALYSYVMNSKYPVVAKAGMMFFIALGLGILFFDYTTYYAGFTNFVSTIVIAKFLFYGAIGLVAMYIGIAPIMGGHNKMEEYALKVDEMIGQLEESKQIPSANTIVKKL